MAITVFGCPCMTPALVSSQNTQRRFSSLFLAPRMRKAPGLGFGLARVSSRNMAERFGSVVCVGENAVPHASASLFRLPFQLHRKTVLRCSWHDCSEKA